MRAHSAGGIQIVAIAGAIFVGLLGTIYTAAAEGADEAFTRGIVTVQRAELPPPASPLPGEPVIPAGYDAPEAFVAMLDAERDEIVDAETGVRMGPLTFLPAPEPVVEEPPARAAREPRSRARRAAPRPAPLPRLHADPGRHVILTARAMNARGEAINGSCYRYLSEVFDRAGHGGWRTRRVVYQGGPSGPYANLDQLRAGDWLYIVNHPDRTPVGTHSVLFVGWEDRARGYARVIEHPGWGAAATGQERGYDVSRTYRITRPVLGR